MNDELLWHQISLENPISFNNFLSLFKVYLEQVKERDGKNAIYFLKKSSPNDYSKVYLSLSKEDNNLFEELLKKHNSILLAKKPSEEISIVFSDKDAPSFEQGNESFIQ